MTQDLITQALHGDSNAWTQIVQDFSPMVFAIALSSTGNLHDSQDIVQEVFLRAYIHVNTLDDKRKFPAWLRQIAENICISRARRKKRIWLPLQGTESPGIMAEEAILRTSSQEPLIEQSDLAIAAFEARDIVNKALRTLSEKLRITATLHYMDGLDYTEIANRLGLPGGTVKRRLHDARQILKQEVIKLTSEKVVLKHAVGLETTGKCHTPIFVRGLHLPVSWTKMFSTANDNQEEIIVHILQGDSNSSEECRSIAALKITGFKSEQEKKEPKIWVTFQIDRTGQFHCEAFESPDKSLSVKGDPSRIETETDAEFTGYGGKWGIW